MTKHYLIRFGVLLASVAACAFGQDTAESYYQAIRNNDLPKLHALVKAGGVNTKDSHGTTPLHFAAAYGSVESVRVLLAAGAEVNARNDFEATPLMWSAVEPEKVRLLIGKGADVNAKSKMGRTAVWIAAANDGGAQSVKLLLENGAKLDGSEILAATAANDMVTIRMLLDRGQDVNTKDQRGFTPMMNAAANGNLKAIQLLLAKGADVNAVSNEQSEDGVKHGPIALGNFTPLLLALPYGGPDVVKTLLDAGAKVNAVDVRNMNPLMYAVATDRADVRTVRLLLDRKADTQAKDGEGLTAADWALKMNNPAILKELGVSRPAVAAKPNVVIPVGLLGVRDPRPAAAKSIELLQRASGSFFKEGGCGSCHSQNMTSIAVNAAWASHIPVNEEAKAAEFKGAQLGYASFEQPLLQRGDPPAVDILSYGVLQLASEGMPANRTTDAMVHNIMAQQKIAGNWHLGGISRPPSMDGDIHRTATAIRAIALYAPAGRKAEAQARITRAANWLASAQVKGTDDLDMQLLGLKWAGLPRRAWQPGLQKLIAQQRADGGWGQIADLESDAYATGQALYTMHELGVPVNDAVYRRGVQYLLQTQAPDGSWHVKSRAPKLQPYFDTIFPYGHDQWISSWATAWAATALSYASGPQQIARR